MRGGDERTGSLFSYVDLETRVGEDNPLRTIRSLVNEALLALSPDFSAMYSRMGPAFDPAGKAPARHAVAGVLLDPLGTALDGAVGVRSLVPLVRWHRRR